MFHHSWISWSELLNVGYSTLNSCSRQESHKQQNKLLFSHPVRWHNTDDIHPGGWWQSLANSLYWSPFTACKCLFLKCFICPCIYLWLYGLVGFGFIQRAIILLHSLLANKNSACYGLQPLDKSPTFFRVLPAFLAQNVQGLYQYFLWPSSESKRF